jgi:hypothetical protein
MDPYNQFRYILEAMHIEDPDMTPWPMRRRYASIPTYTSTLC